MFLRTCIRSYILTKVTLHPEWPLLAVFRFWCAFHLPVTDRGT